jgi:CheY-like chemotaxis protein
MTQPLALVCYERILPGTQLVNRLQDSGYRVETLGDADALVESAVEHKPMLILVDLVSTARDVGRAVDRVRKASDTRHIPVIAFFPETSPELEAAGRSAGATLVVSESAVLNHLPHLLEQALQI